MYMIIYLKMMLLFLCIEFIKKNLFFKVQELLILCFHVILILLLLIFILLIILKFTLQVLLFADVDLYFLLINSARNLSIHHMRTIVNNIWTLCLCIFRCGFCTKICYHIFGGELRIVLNKNFTSMWLIVGFIDTTNIYSKLLYKIFVLRFNFALYFTIINNNLFNLKLTRKISSNKSDLLHFISTADINFRTIKTIRLWSKSNFNVYKLTRR